MEPPARNMTTRALAPSPWNAPETVAGFAQSPPNPVLMRVAAEELRRAAAGRALDLGCGAGRNAIPLARLGWHVLGLNLSLPMLAAAAARARSENRPRPGALIRTTGPVIWEGVFRHAPRG